MSYDFDHQQPQGLSAGAKTAIGCGAVAFLLMVVICGGIVWVGYLAVDKAQEVVQQVIQELEKQTEAFAVRFEAQGFDRVKGQMVEVTKDVERPTVYTAQVFRLEADSAADLAVMAQVAEINGTINGDLHFLGQSLTIHPDAVITGNLHVQMAQVVDNRGTVEGEVIEDERLDIDLPDPTTPPEMKPAPGDVIDRPEQPAAEPEATESGDTPEPAAPTEDPAAAEAPVTDAAPAADADSTDADETRPIAD
jgi:hypothetical protein